jgi:hypothetical protein
MTSSRSSRFPRAGATVGAIAALLMLTPASVAFAAWSTRATGSGAGAAATMPNGVVPSGSVSGTSVTLSWPTADLSSGAPVAGYVISRYNAANGSPTTVGASCSGIIATTSCTEQAVPTGSWVYTVTPVQGNWSGAASAPSAPLSVS